MTPVWRANIVAKLYSGLTVWLFVGFFSCLSIGLVAASAPAIAQPAIAPTTATPDLPADLPPERVEADVSTRTIAVTSAFSGTEIVAFGSVDPSRQPSAEAGTYDVAIVLEGAPIGITARRKQKMGGLWVNTEAAQFESAPSFYAIASTRPVEEIADVSILKENGIGLEYVKIAPTTRTAVETPLEQLKAFRLAVIRLKQQQGLYLKADYAVGFIGRSLFRSSLSMPSNVPVGQLQARVYLFRDGVLLSTHKSRVSLQRAGLELWLHSFAMRSPAAYGIMAVALATFAGLLASAAFRRGR